MSRRKIRKKEALPVPAKAAIVVLVTLLLLFVTLYSVSLAVIRSADAGARELLCGTMAERNLFCTDWFFTSDEIARATEYTVPEAAETAAVTSRAEATLPQSDTYTVQVYEISSGALRLGSYAETAGADRVSIGLAAYPGMVFADGLLSHTGEADYSRFCFCGMAADGTLRIGADTPVRAVNAGYLWGVSCERVLVSGGVPASDLRGGYGMRAAIGQRADGSLFLLICAERKDRLYPRGITYGGLAYLCHREGAVNAAALPLAGKTLAGGKTVGRAPGEAGYSLSAVIAAD